MVFRCLSCTQMLLLQLLVLFACIIGTCIDAQQLDPGAGVLDLGARLVRRDPRQLLLLITTDICQKRGGCHGSLFLCGDRGRSRRLMILTVLSGTFLRHELLVVIDCGQVLANMLVRRQSTLTLDV